jgi:putative membrane protein
VPDHPEDEIDYRFSMANERTFLAWVRTAFGLLAGGLVAAKALNFDHEIWRWALCGPPLIGGAVLSLRSRGRWRAYDSAMRGHRPLPVGRDADILGVALAVYALVVVAAIALD